MSEWSTATTELERRLFDSADAKLSWRKKCVGRQDGVNRTFTTLENRRVTDFTSPEKPLGVYVNDVAVTATEDFPAFGEFTLPTAPSQTDEVVATYYFEYFIDSERQDFVARASEWLGFGTNYLVVPEGLRPAALLFACSEAYQALSVKAMRTLTETFRLEDAPNERTKTPAEIWLKSSESMLKKAKDLRDQYYTRQGKPLQPLYGAVVGKVKNIP